MTIRPATKTDAPQIAAIWNTVIRDTVITFNTVEKSDDEVGSLITQDTLVWEAAGQVMGFARFFPFRGGPGYRHTAEHTIMLHADARGRGGGKALLVALCDMARSKDIRMMIAGCSAECPAAIGFHAACGFETVATMPEVGFKFGRWIDLVLMQKRL
ncbi:N-acetyltransferase family protein [Yoonia sp. BS5-3]|uniref:N-acetyltransferase family protein n=1 Tax=Yoonia phaeophyticola TaxID=3137369 RepID=A0ABZ2V9U1_9RHOB